MQFHSNNSKTVENIYSIKNKLPLTTYIVCNDNFLLKSSYIWTFLYTAHRLDQGSLN